MPKCWLKLAKLALLVTVGVWGPAFVWRGPGQICELAKKSKASMNELMKNSLNICSLRSFRKNFTNTYLDWMKINLIHSDLKLLLSIKLEWKFKIVIFLKNISFFFEIFDTYFLALSRESKLKFFTFFFDSVHLIFFLMEWTTYIHKAATYPAKLQSVKVLICWDCLNLWYVFTLITFTVLSFWAKWTSEQVHTPL